MRAFVASFLPPQDVVRIDAFVSALVESSAGVLRPVPRSSIHITHAFIGDIDRHSVSELTASVSEAIDGVGAIDIGLEPPAVLLSRGTPRLVMAEVTTGAPALHALSRAIVTRLRTVPTLDGLPMPHAPHVTLARVRRDASRRAARHLTQLMEGLLLPVTTTRITSVDVVQSMTTSDGPIYVSLESVALRP